MFLLIWASDLSPSLMPGDLSFCLAFRWQRLGATKGESDQSGTALTDYDGQLSPIDLAPLANHNVELRRAVNVKAFTRREPRL